MSLFMEANFGIFYNIEASNSWFYLKKTKKRFFSSNINRKNSERKELKPITTVWWFVRLKSIVALIQKFGVINVWIYEVLEK